MTHLSVAYFNFSNEFVNSNLSIIFFKRKVFQQGYSSDIIEDAHQGLKNKRSWVPSNFNILSSSIVQAFVLTSCMIPQTLNTSPHSDSFGPQNLQAILIAFKCNLSYSKNKTYRPLAVSWCQKWTLTWSILVYGRNVWNINKR